MLAKKITFCFWHIEEQKTKVSQCLRDNSFLMRAKKIVACEMCRPRVFLLFTFRNPTDKLFFILSSSLIFFVAARVTTTKHVVFIEEWTSWFDHHAYRHIWTKYSRDIFLSLFSNNIKLRRVFSVSNRLSFISDAKRESLRLTRVSGCEKRR